jgi:hypothetical protein
VTSEQDVRDEKRTKWAIRERWSYVILALFITVLFLIFGFAGVIYIRDNNRAWCEIIHASLPATAPTLPASPTPQESKRYTDYQIVVRLGQRLGCL